MTQAGIPVPPGFVVLANAFDRFTAETGLNEEIKARLEAVNPEDVNSVEKASVVLRDVIHDTAMPKDLSNEILAAYDKLARNSLPYAPRPQRKTPLLPAGLENWNIFKYPP